MILVVSLYMMSELLPSFSDNLSEKLPCLQDIVIHLDRSSEFANHLFVLTSVDTDIIRSMNTNLILNVHI